ncbi:hypothetical protein NYE67_20410 [Solibacillus sp. FSL W8-0474]|uniref:hypothetical protein n=1 Tax=Solibacillus sp. FSL W8-0474 TaxID=2975336 RepID=UPI0030F4D319
MANLPVNPEFNDNLRQLETGDSSHADTFNPNFQKLLNNDVFLKNEVGKAGKQLEEFGNVVGGLDERLGTATTFVNSEFEKVTKQLAQKASEKIVNLRNYVRFGRLTLPPDFFHNIDFMLYRDMDGKMKHNFDVNRITFDYTKFYVSASGKAANDGMTEATPWQTLNYAIDQIEANPAVTSAEITVLSNLSRSMAQINSKTLTKNYIIKGKNENTILSTAEPNLTWTADGTSFKATRSTVSGVFDNKYKVEFGLPTRYERKIIKAECDAQKGSWYTDGSSIWVNTLDGRIPDTDIFPCLNVTLWKGILGADKKFIVRNIVGLNGSAGQAFNIYSTGNIGQLILDNVKILNTQANTENSIEIKGIKYSWLFNVITAYAGRDGVNYHTSVVDAGMSAFVFEYNCVAFENGLTDTVNFNNNCSTAHDGMRVLRIGTIGYKSKGPVIADVNGCYSILIDCVAHDSVINTGRSTKVAYYFDDAPSSLIANPNGKAMLINCQGGGDVTWSISGDASFKNGKIQVLNFIGQGFPTDLNLSLLNEVTQ